MTIALQIVLSLGGLLLAFLGSGFLTDPVTAGADFGITVEGAHALTSIRSDFTGFFFVSGACFIWGAWARRSDPLIIGSALMLVTLAARIISYIIDGGFDGFVVPMAVEAVLGIAGLIGAKVLPQQA